MSIGNLEVAFFNSKHQTKDQSILDAIRDFVWLTNAKKLLDFFFFFEIIFVLDFWLEILALKTPWFFY